MRCNASEPTIEPELRKGKRVLKLSNLDKPFWPDEGITKGDLLAYYRDVAPVLVPHLKDRPFTMKRYPDGWNGKFFFQKDAPKHMPDWIPTAQFEASTRDKPPQRRLIDFPLVNDELALLWTVNMGCIDMNTWYSRVDKPSRPDFVLFDLDPSPDVGFPEAIHVALLIKQTLDLLELESHAKTSGSEGIHILVPVARRHTFTETREFSEIIAGAIARAHPGLATTEWTKAKRRGVLIDTNQNGEGKTIASAYSVRPKPGAPVSTPLRWDEVNESLDPAAFTMDAVLERVAKEGDLFEGVLILEAVAQRGVEVAALDGAEERQAGLDALDLDGEGRTRPLLALEPEQQVRLRRSVRADELAADDRVAELLRDPSRCRVRLEGRGGDGSRAELPEGELDHGGPHLGSHPLALEAVAEPGSGPDRAPLAESLGSDPLDSDQDAVEPGAEVDLPVFGCPRLARRVVIREEGIARQVVRPRDAERHLAGWVDSGRGELVQLVELGLGREP